MDLSPGDAPAAAVVAAVKANWAQFYLHLGRAPGSELAIGRHLSWLLTGVPDAFLNVVFRADLPPGQASEIIDEALRHFRSRQVSRLSWWVETSDTVAGQQLRSRGLTFDAGATAMAADLRAVQEGAATIGGLEIVPVEDRAALRAWISVMRVGFGLPTAAERRLLGLFSAVGLEPPMRTYLAMLDRRPVATSQLFVGAGVAGIYNVTCLPEARGRGIGAAVTRVALLEARRQGCDLGILQASDLGRPVYRRLGFRDYGRLNVYQLSRDDPASSP